jgi:hypothetical protein
MKNLITGLMALALVAAGASAQARGKAGDSPSQKSTGSSASDQSSRMSTGSSDARQLIKDWPQVSQQAARSMLDRYGQPDVVSNMMLVWKDKAPFTRITVTREAVRHLFPMEHQDVLTEEISLAVPVEKVSELARFDGSILIDRTKGTVAARSDKESSNFLALNLADDIINGKRDADSARKFYADTLAKQMSGKSSAYTDKLNFSVTGDTSYPDSTWMQPSGSSSSGSSSESSGGSSSEPMTPSDQDSGGMSSPSGGGSSPSGGSQSNPGGGYAP